MVGDLLKTHITEPARFAISTLGDEDRRIVSAWIDHLRNWHHDEHIRSRSRPLTIDPTGPFALQTSTDIIIGFKVLDDEIVVLAIFREDALRTFSQTAAAGLV
jgi:hypothetical protein